MIIIGELINASRKAIKAAIEAQRRGSHSAGGKRPGRSRRKLHRRQRGHLRGQRARIPDVGWLETVQQVTDKPCAIDSPDPLAIEAALAAHRGTAMINSMLPGKGSL